MSSEYKSMLISKLYNVNEDSVYELMDEIEEIKDPIFVYPLYEAYKRNKNERYVSSILDCLRTIDSDELIKFALEISKDEKQKNYRVDALAILDTRKYYDESGLSIIQNTLTEFIEKKSNLVFDLEKIVSYFLSGKFIDKNFFNQIKDIFLEKSFGPEVRKYAFEQWLISNPSNHLQQVIKNFSIINKDAELEAGVAKVIANRKGDKINKLKEMIKEKGGVKAKHIIASSEEKRKQQELNKEQQKQVNMKKQHSNHETILEIIQLRKTINEIAEEHENIGFIIFPANEDIFNQSETATDKANFMKACVELRGIIWNLNKNFGEHGLNEKEIASILPSMDKEHYGKSLNKFCIFLKSKKIDIKEDVCGLTKLNRLLGLLGAHPEAKEEAKRLLQKEGLYDMYKSEDRVGLHRKVLEIYKKSLEKIRKIIK